MAPLAFLRPDQAAIVCHPARIKVLSMGRRWGKTVLGGTASLATAWAGGYVAWVVPSYRNARPVWRFIERAIRPVKPVMRVRSADGVVEFPSGGFIAIYTADNPDSILGESFDLVVLDEAARVKQSVWTDTLLPMLADRNGKALLISTPRGRNWFYHEWLAGMRGDWGMAAWKAPSADNPNPLIQRAARLAASGRVPPLTYQQEWLAEFVEREGLVFRRVDEAVARGAELGAAKAREGATYVFGVDWGRTVDATVVCVVDVEQRALVHVDRFTGIGFELQAGRLRSLAERFHPASIVAEYNNFGGPLVEQLQREGLPVRAWKATNATKAGVIEDLSLAFETDTIALVAHSQLVEELKAMESSELPSGMVRYAAPEGMHDDCVIAAALAWTGASSPKWEVL